MKYVASLSVLLFLVAAATAEDAKAVLERLQGEWEVEKVVINGEILPLDKVIDNSYSLKGDKLIPSKSPDDPATLEVFPDKKPAWVNMTDRDKKTMLGIYRVEKDRWEICARDDGQLRPTEFKSTKDVKTYIMILKRKVK